ncbi:MAG: hypothetical protein IJB11_01270, partial [Oscillospiraceae bacterium]|nr:hypothetical protein [Oscillospiraceae bacterium]
PIGRNEACPSGTYKVALVIAPTTANGTPDYHWYRQDPSGLWSHKQGTTQIKQVDNSEHFITDPEIANRGSYSIFVGYFAVTPWEKLYTDIVTSSYNSVALRNDSPVISINQANSIKVGMSIDEVINITGGVGTYIESESAIHQYTTSSGDSILVFYETNHTGTHVVSEVRNSSTPCS